MLRLCALNVAVGATHRATSSGNNSHVARQWPTSHSKQLIKLMKSTRHALHRKSINADVNVHCPGPSMFQLLIHWNACTCTAGHFTTNGRHHGCIDEPSMQQVKDALKPHKCTSHKSLTSSFAYDSSDAANKMTRW